MRTLPVFRPTRLAALAAVLALHVPAVHAQPIAARDGINAGATPVDQFLLAGSIGWAYTPGASYALSGVLTHFLDTGAASDRTITVELRDASRATVLRSATFHSREARGQLGGALFAQPFTLSAGVTYFVGFRGLAPLDHANVATYLGANFTDAPDATRLAGAWYDLDGSGSYDAWLPAADAEFEVQPILQFVGSTPPTTVTPEPATWALLATGLAGVGGAAVRRRRVWCPMRLGRQGALSWKVSAVSRSTAERSAHRSLNRSTGCPFES